ncbi:1-aminocyclopropane-1-carboxylate oxidase homolog 11-like [Silene latifolia]|uniref:1-aminocyclopropane-1-carboxylate oxidase homolog 11-like n=1 Tax=Silene latifolia TaxID=37657 RepID=UPI003D76A89A
MSTLTLNMNSMSLNDSNYSKEEEVTKLKNAKATVKHMMDSGLTQVPKIFTNQTELWQDESVETYNRDLKVPVIDLRGFEGEGKRRKQIVAEILDASKTWGIFKVVGHGVPKESINDMLEGVKKFNEQPMELKTEYYSHDPTKKVRYHLSINPISFDPVWKDTFSAHYEDQPVEDSEAFVPSICRKEMSDYVTYATELKETLSELMSEALGLRSDYLRTSGCIEARKLVSHYSPPCPDPSLTMSTSKHSDPFFLTFLVQNNINGLQAHHENQWIDVTFEDDAILVVIGDLLQLITNDVFKSTVHRVVPSTEGPRLSSGAFFLPSTKNHSRIYGPIKELYEHNNGAPVYRETSFIEYIKTFPRRGPCGYKTLSKFWV